MAIANNTLTGWYDGSDVKGIQIFHSHMLYCTSSGRLRVHLRVYASPLTNFPYFLLKHYYCCILADKIPFYFELKPYLR